jgi:AraC-like DNA-binding protein
VMAAITQSLFDNSITLHRELRARLEQDKTAIEHRIAEVDEVIQRLESEAKRAARSTNGKVQRRAKGENAKMISDLFSEPGIAMTMKDIAQNTGLSFSSVQRVLENSGGYVQAEDGLWKRKVNGQ